MIEAIVLKVHHYGEADLVVRMLTKQGGKLAALARSARKSKKRFSGGLDLFDHGLFELNRSRGSLPVLGGFTSLGSQRQLRESLDKFILASFLCECFDLLLPENGEEDAEQVFSYLREGLAAIEASTNLREGLRAIFGCTACVLKISGYLDPDLDLTPSKKNLASLIALLERSTEKKLETGGELQKLVLKLEG